MPNNQAEFERAVMEGLYSSLGEFGEFVRLQYSSATVAERWGSGAGFYTDFVVTEDSPALPTGANLGLNHYGALLKGVGDGHEIDGYSPVGCQLHFHDGKLACLECYNYGGGWPENHYEFQVLPIRN
ncbi:MAG: hypothetical protein WBA44_05740 [Mesorhizobium sp.]